MKMVAPFQRVLLKKHAQIDSPGFASRSAHSGTPVSSAQGSISCALNQAEARIYAPMTARAVSWDISCCASSAPVVRVDGGGEAELAATAAGAVGNVVVAGFWRGCASVEVVATGEAEVASISGSREETKR